MALLFWIGVLLFIAFARGVLLEEKPKEAFVNTLYMVVEFFRWLIDSIRKLLGR